MLFKLKCRNKLEIKYKFNNVSMRTAALRCACCWNTFVGYFISKKYHWRKKSANIIICMTYVLDILQNTFSYITLWGAWGSWSSDEIWAKTFQLIAAYSLHRSFLFQNAARIKYLSLSADCWSVQLPDLQSLKVWMPFFQLQWYKIYFSCYYYLRTNSPVTIAEDGHHLVYDGRINHFTVGYQHFINLTGCCFPYLREEAEEALVKYPECCREKPSRHFHPYWCWQRKKGWGSQKCLLENICFSDLSLTRSKFKC